MKLSLASSLILISSLPFTQAASIRGSRKLANNCGVTSFSYYTFDKPYEVTKPLYSVLDMTDVRHGKVNIIANVGEPCGTEPIQCVKLSFAGNTRKERVAPYSLYGDKPGSHFHRGSPKASGKQLLEAWTYTDRDCTKGESGYKSMEVDVIPADEPLEGTVALDTFAVAYESTWGEATEDETNLAGQTTCEFFNQAFSSGLLYKSDVSLTDFSCDYSLRDGVHIDMDPVPPIELATLSQEMVEQLLEDESTEAGITPELETAVLGDIPPLAIEFDISASFQKSTGSNPYSNRRVPTAEELSRFVRSLVEDNQQLGPHAPTLLDYIQGLSGSPYASAIGFSLV